MMRALLVMAMLAIASAPVGACEPGGLLWKVTHPIQAIRAARPAVNTTTCSASATSADVVQVVSVESVPVASAPAPVFVRSVAMSSAPVFVQRDETPGPYLRTVANPVQVPRSMRVIRAPFVSQCVGGLCFKQ